MNGIFVLGPSEWLDPERVRIRAWDDGDALAGHTVAIAWEVQGRPATHWYAGL